MAYVLILTTTKPADAAWFSASNIAVQESTFTNIDTVVHASTGLKHVAHRNVNANVKENTYVFDTEADANAFQTALLNNASFATVAAYYATAGITQAWTTIG